ncbi:MAG: hypothetical protein LBQ48_08540 [Oscillospiraceae bacterium]|jgi:hypothetical protein|nr:hypothetical protein [Oscillospiraceae bacterium]
MKDGYFTEQVDAFFTELQEESIRNLRKIDAEYNDWRVAHAEASQEYEAILNDLPYRDMKHAEKFKDDIEYIVPRVQSRRRISAGVAGF